MAFHQEALNASSQSLISHFCPESKKKKKKDFFCFYIVLTSHLPYYKPTLAPTTQTHGLQWSFFMDRHNLEFITLSYFADYVLEGNVRLPTEILEELLATYKNEKNMN